ncbi:MAG: hypothetical protein ABI488_15405 [Polyangiaceae bacterium]
MNRASLVASGLMFLALAPSCGGGQTGDLSGKNTKPGGPTGSSTGCDDHASDVALDDASALGFSAQGVLAFTEKQFQTPISWKPLHAASYAPGVGTSTLSLTLVSLSKAQLVHSTPTPSTSGGGVAIGVQCPPDRLSIAVHAELTTADGALAESFDTNVEAAEAHLAFVQHQIPVAQIAGSFAITPADPIATVSPLELNAMLVPGGMAGDLSASLSAIGPEVASLSVLSVASFPDDRACRSDNGSQIALAVSADNAAVGVSASDALARIVSAGALPVQWSGGDSTELDLQASGLSAGCLMATPANRGASRASVSYAVKVKATTTDGKVNGSYDAQLVTSPVATGGFTETLVFDGQYAVEDVAQTGFVGVTVPQSAQRLAVMLRAEYPDAGTSGVLRLNALVDPPCSTEPPAPSYGGDGSVSVPGCAGTMVTPLASGSWGTPSN